MKPTYSDILLDVIADYAEENIKFSPRSFDKVQILEVTFRAMEIARNGNVSEQSKGMYKRKYLKELKQKRRNKVIQEIKDKIAKHEH